jgi:membrane-bound inhibitor of C-type lysozyme
MGSAGSAPRWPRPPAVGAVAAALVLAACASSPSKDEIEAAKNTISCQLAGERLVIRFDTGEARLLMPAGDRVALYQIPAASGIRYSNGSLELRGKGMDLQLVRDGMATPLAGCEPYQLPK